MSSQGDSNKGKEFNVSLKESIIPKEKFDISHLIIPFVFLPSQNKRGHKLQEDKNRQEFLKILKDELKRSYYLF
jgi:hypothetical protein